jgi:peptide/nickel transport system permease protein
MNAGRILGRIGRALLLIAAAALGTTALVRYAPGYFSDAREIDARYSGAASTELSTFAADNANVDKITLRELTDYRHGRLGTSRQYQVPVAALLRSRIATSAQLLARGIGCGWLIAFLAALPVSSLQRNQSLFAAPFTILLAIPIAAMATACILAQMGGALLVISLTVAARDFKFLHGVLAGGWKAPHLISARTRGVRLADLVRVHILPSLLPELAALMGISIVTSLGALVPVEVLFNVPGVGQLAWNAVMNRDLPVLLAVTLLMATVVSGASMFCGRWKGMEPA